MVKRYVSVKKKMETALAETGSIHMDVMFLRDRGR